MAFTKEQQILFRIGWLHQQISGIFGNLKHILRGTQDMADSKAEMVYVESEIGDLIVQTHLLCSLLELDYRKCEQLGWERYYESKEAWEKAGYGDKWV